MLDFSFQLACCGLARWSSQIFFGFEVPLTRNPWPCQCLLPAHTLSALLVPLPPNSLPPGPYCVGQERCGGGMAQLPSGHPCCPPTHLPSSGILAAAEPVKAQNKEHPARAPHLEAASAHVPHFCLLIPQAQTP